MDNKINNIQDAIVNAYNNGLLNGKTPEEAAEILFNFGDKMHNASNFFNYTKEFQAEHTLDISQSMTKEKLYNEMKRILRMDQTRGWMYEGNDKEFDEFFELFFNIFDQNGDGSMDTSELTLFDNNDDGDLGINVYTFHKTLATDELEHFTYNPDDEDTEE